MNNGDFSKLEREIEKEYEDPRRWLIRLKIFEKLWRTSVATGMQNANTRGQAKVEENGARASWLRRVFSRASHRFAFREGDPWRAGAPEDAVTRVTYHHVTSSEFRIRGAHLDADTPAVKTTNPPQRRERERERERSNDDEPRERREAKRGWRGRRTRRAEAKGKKKERKRKERKTVYGWRTKRGKKKKERKKERKETEEDENEEEEWHQREAEQRWTRRMKMKETRDETVR